MATFVIIDYPPEATRFQYRSLNSLLSRGVAIGSGCSGNSSCKVSILIDSPQPAFMEYLVVTPDGFVQGDELFVRFVTFEDRTGTVFVVRIFDIL
jgi:hypothetical protein